MATLQLRNIDDRLYNFLKNSARRQNRSVSQEVVTIIQQHLHFSQPANATLEFLALSGAWKDERDAEEIIADMRSSRSQSSTVGWVERNETQTHRLLCNPKGWCLFCSPPIDVLCGTVKLQRSRKRHADCFENWKISFSLLLG